MAKDLSQAYEALQKAHAAGDTTRAQTIAEYIRGEEAKPKSEALVPIGVTPGELVAGAVSGEAREPSGNWFSVNTPKPTSLGEAAGETVGGAVGGALAGAALPGLLKAAGKVIPGTLGKGSEALGEVLSRVPLKERVVKGAGGGAAAGLTGAAGDAFGLPKAVTAGAELATGGLGESAASFLSKESGQLLRFIGNASYANVAGASRALQGMLSPNKALNEATARKLQARLFGEKTEGYLDSLVGSENRIAVQEALRKADPSLVPQAQAQAGAAGTRAPWETSTGEMGAMGPLSGSREVAAATGQDDVRGAVRAALGGPKALPGPGGAAEAGAAGRAGFEAGKAAVTGNVRRAAEAEAKRQEAIAAEALKPASQIYRERMFNGVAEAIKEGKTFSSTPEFAAFEKTVQDKIQQGYIGPKEGQELLRTLRLDRAKGNATLQQEYAKRVDDHIRQWGKPQETGGQTGAAAIDATTAREVRGKLQEAFNQYTQRIGLGKVEQQYRSAYSQEMTAEAKDKMQHFLAGFGTAKEFEQMARSVNKDPQALDAVRSGVARHLANTEPQKVVSEFSRLQKVLVNAKMVEPKDLAVLREGAEAVKRTADKGLQARTADLLKQQLMLAMARKAGATAGGAAARPAELQEQD